MKKIFTFIIGMVAMVATACSEYQEVVDYEPLVLNSPESVEIEGIDEASFQVSYNALSRVKMSTDCDWIVVPSSFDGDARGTFTITTIANPTVTERTGNLILTATDPRFAGGMSYSKSITVTQGGGRPTISAYIENKNNTQSYTAPDEGKTVSLCVKSNADFKVNADFGWEAAWLKFNNKSSYSGKGDGDAYVTIAMTIAANPNEWDRTARITIHSEANSVGQNYYIDVKQQKWNIVWNVSNTEVGCGYKGISKYPYLVVYSSLSWEATCDAGWIELETTQYTSSNKYTSGYINLRPTIKENMSEIDRSAEIVIQCTEAGYTDRKLTVTIKQTGRPELYFYDTADYSVSNMAGNYIVQFLSENAWEASTDATWLTISKTSGSGNIYTPQYLSFSVQPNTSTERRTATITLEVNGDRTVNATLTVVQGSAGELYYRRSQKLNLTDDLFDVPIAEHTFDEARGEGRVTFNGTMTALTDQELTSYSVWGTATAVYLPSTVKSIGNAAFRCCYYNNGLTISLPEGLERIGDYAFEYCTISAFNIPSSVTEIGERAFDGCGHITDIVIPEGVKVIKSYTFHGCANLTSVTLPNSVESIEDFAFSDCEKLETITMPSNLREIGGGAFSGCQALQSIEIPATVRTIGNFAFSDCTALKEITIPEGVETIGNSAFSNCTALKEITIPEGVKTIEDHTFYECSSLAKVTLPLSLTHINYYAFYGCSGVKEVYIKDKIKWNDIYFDNEYSNPVFTGKADLYVNNEKLTEIDVDADGFTNGISNYAFRGCRSLESVELGTKQTKDGAFAKCYGLTKVVFGGKTITLGEGVFEGCSSLVSIVFSNLARCDIPRKTFYNCDQLSTVEISPMSYIGESAFEGCFLLGRVKITPNTYYGYTDLSINKRAFADCKIRLSSFDCSQRTRVHIGEEAFYQCRALETLKLPSNQVLSVGKKAFYDCKDLNTITISGHSNESCSISEYAFSLCSSVTDIILKNIKSIGTKAFNDCTALTAIECQNTAPPRGSTNMFPSSASYQISVPSASLSNYKSAPFWSEYAERIVGY